MQRMPTRHSLRRFGVLAVAVLVSTSSCSSSSDSSPSSLAEPLQAVIPVPENSPTLARIAASGRLRVGVKFDVPLFGFQDKNTKELSGFDIEIANAIAEDLFPNDPSAKGRIDFIEALSKNREQLLREATVDLVISTYTINDARKQLVDFAGPYYIAGQDILASAGAVRAGRVRGIGDLAGKRVCSVTGSTSLANLRAAAPEADTSVTKDKYSECFEALKSGEVEAMTTDDVILLGLAQGFPEFALTGNPFHTEPYGIGIAKDDFELRRLVNRVLLEMFSDGRWAEAFRRTVGQTGALVPSPPELDQ